VSGGLADRVGSFFRTRLRKWCPPLFRLSKRVYFAWRRGVGTRRLRRRLKQRPWNLTLGAGDLVEEGWVPTEIYELDITRERDWQRFFAPGSVDAMLAEHVWEHLEPADAVEAARMCFKYLKEGGRLRVAVPDGGNPDPAYIEAVRVGGTGPGADDHKALYTSKTLAELFAGAGFDVRLVEYHDEAGRLQSLDRDEADGIIHRSASRTPEAGERVESSLILDAVKGGS
jgi:predicted SAM-dependent methyltransferase